MEVQKQFLKNEKGSSTIEFIGVLPFAFLMLMIIWQFIVSVHGVVVTQSAANEAAKVYSLTKESEEATEAAKKIVSTAGNYLSFTSAPVNEGKDFTVKVNVKIHLVFLPKKLFNYNPPSLSFSSEVHGRVIE